MAEVWLSFNVVTRLIESFAYFIKGFVVVLCETFNDFYINSFYCDNFYLMEI